MVISQKKLYNAMRHTATKENQLTGLDFDQRIDKGAKTGLVYIVDKNSNTT